MNAPSRSSKIAEADHGNAPANQAESFPAQNSEKTAQTRGRSPSKADGLRFLQQCSLGGVSPEDAFLIALTRFEKNLYPSKQTEYPTDPGVVLNRLDRAGLSKSFVTNLLFAYALPTYLPRRYALARERFLVAILKYQKKIAKLNKQDAALEARFYRLLGQLPVAKAAEQREYEAEQRIRALRQLSMSNMRSWGVSPLEYLVVLREAADLVGSQLTNGELSGLVWAAVTALYPGKTRDKVKAVDPDSLARSLERFRKRRQNQDFVRQLRHIISDSLSAHRQSKPPTFH